MATKELRDKTLAFIENQELYLGRKVEITEYISTHQRNYDRHFTTCSYTEFILIRVGARFSGARIMFEGEHLYYEIGITEIVRIDEIEENIYEIEEKYSDMVYRLSKIKFMKI